MPSLPQSQDWVAIVDDDDAIRHSLSRIFRMNGITVRTFSSAEDYLSRAEVTEPSCMVLDVHLGRSSGFDLHDQLLMEGRAPPIIFITAFAELSFAQPEPRSGVRHCLRKPFDTRALLDLVRPHVS